jgi:hypothetical protein
MIAGSAALGPPGMIVGLFSGLLGGLLSSRDEYESYLECQKEKIHSFEKYKNDIL